MIQFNSKLQTYGRDEGMIEGIIREPEKNACFANSRVTNQQ